MKKITYPSLYPVKVGFSRSVVVGNYVFASGCSGQTLETFHVASDNVMEQTNVALEKIRGAIEQTGASMNDIVKIVIYVTQWGDLLSVEDTIQEYYAIHAPCLLDEPPAVTSMCIPALHEPDLLVEIEATAVM